MKFNNFKKYIQRLPTDRADGIRKKNIDTFLNTDTEYYKKHITMLNECSDNLCYVG